MTAIRGHSPSGTLLQILAEEDLHAVPRVGRGGVVVDLFSSVVDRGILDEGTLELGHDTSLSGTGWYLTPGSGFKRIKCRSSGEEASRPSPGTNRRPRLQIPAIGDGSHRPDPAEGGEVQVTSRG